jgi:EAL domain-containing protein (putative c-di-GMP-specific phosphodiesterase class I)
LDKLIIEVTESVLMENIDEFLYEINKLKSFGIRFEIDDFGTGYSSLNYFKKLPVYALKIDKSFIDNIPSSNEDSAIVKAIIKMAHTLGKKVVAEGVETKEQFQFLQRNNCDYIQGYYFSKPLKEEEYIEFINNFNFNDF